MPTTFQCRYQSYAGNNPLNRVDPDGNWAHIVIGALIGGTINLATHWGQINNFGDGLAAFGIGAVAGGLTAATGGVAASSLGFSGGIIGGAISGGAGAIIGSPTLALGNGAYFGDKYSGEKFLTDVGSSFLIGGVVGGIASFIQGNNPLNNAPKVSPQPAAKTPHVVVDEISGRFEDFDDGLVKIPAHNIGTSNVENVYSLIATLKSSRQL